MLTILNSMQEDVTTEFVKENKVYISLVTVITLATVVAEQVIISDINNNNIRHAIYIQYAQIQN